MSKKQTALQENVEQTIARLLEVSKLDTLYRDLYFQRAQELMEPMLSYLMYTRMKESLASLGWFEVQLRGTINRGDWAKTRELTERIRRIKSFAADSNRWLRLGEALYDGVSDTPIDPFSPGLQVFVAGLSQKLREYQARAIEILSHLARADSLAKDFYARRVADFQALSIGAAADSDDEKSEAISPARLQQKALEALEAGNLSQLDQMVLKLMEKPAVQEAKERGPGSAPVEAVELGDDLRYSFTNTTLAAADRLGLAPISTRSRRHLAYLIPHGWQPSFLKGDIKLRSKEQIAKLTYPTGTGDEVKDAIEFFLLNPFITSGGTRYQVCLVVEDLLIEDFAEPEPKQEQAHTGLLAALGLETRWGLTRIDIETALLRNGPRILEEELALDPQAFRLAAIPPDIYTHLALEREWGRKEMWTHFDGYQVREDGKLQALAGGDRRFGGTHDVVSFNPNYTSDKILARFAVVQRKRMMTWHRK
jgi:hypothetical protein